VIEKSEARLTSGRGYLVNSGDQFAQNSDYSSRPRAAILP